MKSTITDAQRQAIIDYVTTHHLPSGLGTKESACSIAAINLVLIGKLTDTIPDCMSVVAGRWIIRIQDAMPDTMRNSDEWRLLLPLAAGTGREFESERLQIILDWMWADVLPILTPIAERHGFVVEWRMMLNTRTRAAAYVARYAAAYAAYAANAAAYAADAAYAAAAANAAAAAAARAAAAAAGARADDDFWEKINPCKVLCTLIECGESK